MVQYLRIAIWDGRHCNFMLMAEMSNSFPGREQRIGLRQRALIPVSGNRNFLDHSASYSPSPRA